MRRVVVAGSLAVFVSFGLLAAATQEQNPPAPIFRGGVTLINVDVYPRENGRVVEGLTPEDFQVFEDGKPQKVEAFEFIRVQPNTLDAERRDPNTKEEGDKLAADPHNRVFVVYLDVYHTTFAGARDTRGPLINFLYRTISAQDLFGVLTPEVPVQQLVFGRSVETLQGDITKYFDWGLRDRAISPLGRPAIEAQLETCMSATAMSLGDALVALNREDMLMTSLEDLVRHLGSIREERTNVLFISEGWIPLPPSTELASLGSGSIPIVEPGRGGRLGLGSQREMRNSSWCDQQVIRLSNIDFDRRFKDLLAAATRANVSFFPVDVGGLRSPGATSYTHRPMGNSPAEALVSRIIQKTTQASVTTLQVLAENTNGQAVVYTNDLGAGLRKVSDDLSAYYLLGYASTNSAVDGKYRRIEVKVNRPKVSVTARRGYLAPSVATVAAVAAAERAAAVPATIAQELARLARLRNDTDLFGYAARAPNGLDVVAEISSAEWSRGRWASGADVRVTMPRPAGAPLVASARIEPGARGAVVHVPLAEADKALSRGTLTVSSGAATLETPVETAAPDATPLLGDPVCWRGTAAARVALRPVADFQFRRSERLHVEWPLSQPVDERSGRILDRRGQPLALGVALTQPTDTTVAADLPLAPLAEGDYVIEVTAKRGDKTERKLLGFRVVR